MQWRCLPLLIAQRWEDEPAPVGIEPPSQIAHGVISTCDPFLRHPIEREPARAGEPRRHEIPVPDLIGFRIGSIRPAGSFAEPAQRLCIVEEMFVVWKPFPLYLPPLWRITLKTKSVLSRSDEEPEESPVIPGVNTDKPAFDSLPHYLNLFTPPPRDYEASLRLAHSVSSISFLCNIRLSSNTVSTLHGGAGVNLALSSLFSRRSRLMVLSLLSIAITSPRSGVDTIAWLCHACHMNPHYRIS